MASSILTVLNKIGEVGRLAIGEMQRLKDVDKQVEFLCGKLEFLMAMVQVAEEGNRIKRDLLVDVWAKQLRDAVFRAEDIVDEYYQEVYHSRPGFERKPTTPFPWIPWFLPSEVPVRYATEEGIKDLLQELENIKTNEVFNMQKTIDGALMTNMEALDRPTMGTMLVDESWRIDYSVGFDDYIKSIISLLLEGKDKLRPTVVVNGEKGIGKSTAVRAVLRDWTIQKNFDICVWVSLVPKSRVDKYLDQIWKQFQEQTHYGGPRSDVKQALGEMKLLLVLDGMENMDELEEILRELPDGAKGSRILVTTQLESEQIKQARTDVTTVKIKCLKRADCQDFLDKVFSGRCRHVYQQNRDKYVQKIYKLSEGIPLAVVLLGGLLYFKDHEEQWNEVFVLLESYFRMRLIKRILTVSYATMPTVLKLCFLYLAAMPPNVPLDLKKLHRLWCAEGILESEIRDDFTEDIVVDRCIRILVSRGLVQRLEDKTKVCINKSVHEFAKETARDTGSMEFDSKFGFHGASKVRGLSIHNYVDRVMRIDKDNCFPKLRALLCDFAEDRLSEATLLGISKGLKKSRMEFLRHSKFLRVLDLNCVVVGTLPDSIGDMIHLRYLGLRSCCLRNLPPSVAKLQNLETFDITDNDVQQVVDEFWKIKKLKHVLAEKLSLSVSAASMDKLTELETLQGVILSSEWTQENYPIKNMEKLHSLAVVSARPANVRLLAKALEGKRTIHQLKIAGDSIPLLCLSKSRPLDYMELNGEILSDEKARQTYHSADPIAAYRIVLRSSSMSQKLLDVFFSKPVVVELELLDNSFTGLKLLLQGSAFTRLEKLKLGNLKALEVFIIEESAVPALASLEIFGCPNLQTISGLKNSQHLKKVVFHNMSDIVAKFEEEDKKLFGIMKHLSTGAWSSAA